MERISIMDTTLRDGEQTNNVSFSKEEKLIIAKYLIEKVKVDAIEVTSAKMSKGEFETLKEITTWAKSTGNLEKIEVLGFVDDNKSLDWIYEAGGKVINLLAKGSLNHLSCQLKKTKEEHTQDIRKIVESAKAKGMTVNVYLEDWSSGMKNSKDYVFYIITQLESFKVDRIMLADTLGILDPFTVYDYLSEILTRFPNIKFDFHGHNDYGFSIANAFAAAKVGVDRIHTTVNGLGERAGNTDLSAAVVALHDHLNIKISVIENELKALSVIVETFSGIRTSPTMPIVGENAFTQNCGVHADGDKKGGLYQTNLDPQRFGRERRYSLGKTSGKASIDQNLKRIGIIVDSDIMKKITARIVELGERKENMTEADLELIALHMIGEKTIEKVKLIDYTLTAKKDETPHASICLEIDGKTLSSNATGDGKYDAFMNALKKLFKEKALVLPELIDYSLRIPPGGKTSALVEATITWKNKNKTCQTKGVDCDQDAAAINATMKMLNMSAF